MVYSEIKHILSYLFLYPRFAVGNNIDIFISDFKKLYHDGSIAENIILEVSINQNVNKIHEVKPDL